jgi:2-phosphosulfolactate phosphatase
MAVYNRVMKINILEFAEGAERARGLTVIIDVFRAFSVGCYAFDSGAAAIIATGSIDEAFALKKNYRNSVLAGERDERKIKGFDYGNSPTEIIMADLKGVTVIHTTTAGTKGLLSAVNASAIITGSLVNAGAVGRYIKSLDPEEVTLVAMGYRGRESAEEDLLCAEIIANRLNNGTENFSSKITALRENSGKRFFKNENMQFSPPSDFFLCTMADRFDFILKATKRYDGNIDLMKIDL